MTVRVPPRRATTGCRLAPLALLAAVATVPAQVSAQGSAERPGPVADTAPAEPVPVRLGGEEFGVTRRGAVHYVERDGRALRLDLWRPDCAGPHPTALVIHGGGWKTGGRGIGDARVLAQALAREGIAAASISYRLAPHATHPAQIEDCRRAIQFLRAEAGRLGLDPNRIAAIGASAGGHLAALLGTEDDRAESDARDPVERASTRPTCVVAICAPFDLLPVAGYTPSTLQIGMVSDFLGLGETGDPQRKLALLRTRGLDASPLHHVSPDDVPMLLIHSDNDQFVPPFQARRMVAALERAKVPHQQLELHGAGHCLFLLARSRDWLTAPPPFWHTIRAFLRTNLLGIGERAAGAGGEQAGRTDR